MGFDSRQMSPAARLERLIELGEGRCPWCGYDLTKPMARPTRDLIVPKVKGGPARLENEVAACGGCNGKRGSSSPSQFIEESRRDRGLDPNATVVADQLDRLQEAIEREGGMRKIRDYVAREGKRVRQLADE
jgi:hypothetical protein